MKFKSVLLAFIVLVLFIVPVSADFSDNFNDLDISDWTVSSGAWTGAYGYLNSSGTMGVITSPSIGSGQQDIQFDFITDNVPPASTYYTRWNWTTDTSNGRGFRFTTTAGTTVLDSFGFTINTITGWQNNKGYTIVINLTASQARVRVYNQGTSTLSPELTNNDQTVAYTPVTTDNIRLDNTGGFSGARFHHFDNIVTTGFKVSGYVNQTSGAVINGATVSYSGGSTTTDSNGRYYFDSVASGTYTFTASKNGFISSSQSIAVTSDKTNQNFTLVNTSVQSTNISWNATEYTRGDTATFYWNIKDDDWGTYDRYFVRLYKNGILQDFSSFNWGCLCYTQLGVGTQFGIYSVLADEPGVYKVTLEKGTIIYTLIDSNETNIRDYSSSYLVLNASYPYHTPVNITYHFGFGGINLNYAIQTYFLNPTTGIYEAEHSFFGLSSGLNTRNIYFEKIGTYVVKLSNVATGTIYDQKTTETTLVSRESNTTIALTTLFIDKDTYFYGDTISGNYTIDNVNWTTGGEIYLDVYNWNKSIVTTEMQGIGFGWTDISSVQEGDLLVNLLNTPSDENFKELHFVSGYNALRIMARNSTGLSTVLAFQNFTLTDLTTTGYGLKLSKYEVSTNEKFFAYATVPENGAKLILVNTGSDLLTGKLLANIGLNQSPATIPISISNEGNYAVILNNPSNNTEIMQNVKVVKSLATPKPTPTPTPGISARGDTDVCTSTIPMLNGWVSLMGWGLNNYTRLIFATIFIIGFIMLGWGITKNGTVGLVLGFLPYSIFASLSFTDCGVEFMPKWVTIMLGIAMALSFRIFR